MTVVGCDLYNGVISGDIACCLNANTGTGSNHAGPTLLIVSDMNEENSILNPWDSHGNRIVNDFRPSPCVRASNRGYQLFYVLQRKKVVIGVNKRKIYCYSNTGKGGRYSKCETAEVLRCSPDGICANNIVLIDTKGCHDHD